MERKSTSLRLDPDLWHRVRIHCIVNREKYNLFVEKALKEKLGEKKK